MGIGTTTPELKLHIKDTWAGIRLESTAPGYASSGSLYAGDGAIFFRNDIAGTNPFWVSVSAPTASLEVAANGYVGIGTYGPTAKLDVAGDAKVSGALTVAGAAVLTTTSPSVVQMTTTQTLTNKTLQNVSLTGTTTTSGNVGIKATTPQGALTIGAGQLTSPVGSASAPSYTFNNNLNTGLYSSGTNTVSIATNGVERWRVYGTGNFASDDFANLPGVVNNTSYKSFHLASPSVKGSTMISMASRNFSTAFLGDRMGDFIIGNEGARPIIFKNGMVYSNSDTLNTGTEQMRIDASGNVGIGTNAPSAKLDVFGDAKITGTLTLNGASVVPASGGVFSGGVTIANDNNANGGLTLGSGTSADGANLRLLSNSGQPQWNIDNYTGSMRFFTESSPNAGGSVKATLTSAGNLGIGTTSPQANLHIVGASGWDTSTVLNLTNGATDFGRTTLRLTGRMQDGNEGWSVPGGARNSIVFSRNLTSGSGTNIGALGEDRFSLQYNMAEDKLGVMGVGGTPKLIIQQDGNVGIGNSSPVGHAPGRKALIIDGSSQDAMLEVWGNNGGKAILQSVNGATYIGTLIKGGGSGDVYFGYGADNQFGPIGATLQGTTGNFGIGITNPTAKLHVAGDVKVQGVLTVNGQPVLTTNNNNVIVPGSITASNIGIQTTTPQGALTIGAGQLTSPGGSATAPSYTFNNNLNTGLYSSGTNSVSISTNGTERWRVYGTGNFASDDFANLPGVVNNSSYKSFHLASPTVKGSTMISMASRNFSTAFLGDRMGDFIIGNEGARPIIFKNGMVYNNSDTLNTGTEQMRIDASGNVGIGTTSPTAKLQVAGDVAISGNLKTDVITKIAPLVIRGTGLNRAAARLIQIGSTQITNSSSLRGLTLTIIHKPTHTLISSGNFDTYGSSTASDQLATALNSLTPDQIGILSSYDSWDASITVGLRSAFKRLGLTKAQVNSTWRLPYAAIFEGASGSPGSAKAVEVVMGNDPAQPYAEIRGWLIDGGYAITPGTVSNALYNDTGDVQAAVVDHSGVVAIKTGLRVPEAGDLSMGQFATGSDPRQ